MLWLALCLQPSYAAVSAFDANVIVREYDFNAVERVQIDNVAGRISVRPMEGLKISAHAIKRKFSDKCALVMEKEGVDVLHLRIDGPSFEECEVDFDVTMPKDVGLVVNGGAGRVDIEGLEDKFEFRLGTGDLRANGKFKQVNGTSGTGKVEVRGIDGGGRIQSQGGSVTLAFNENARGQFDVSTKSGSAEIQVPKGVKVQADLESAGGAASNEVGTWTRTDLSVNLKSETGDLKVKGY